jgi:hypothetical protein
MVNLGNMCINTLQKGANDDYYYDDNDDDNNNNNNNRAVFFFGRETLLTYII